MTHQHNTRPLRAVSRSGVSSLSLLWLLIFASAGLWFLLGPGGAPATQDGSRLAPIRPVAFSNDQQKRNRYRPIERIHVGQRVITPGTDAGALPTMVDPATWRLVKLQAVERWEDGTVDDVRIETL